MKKTKESLKTQAKNVFKGLKKAYPDIKGFLDFSTPFELLVAVVLSAQCTDARVNEVTKTLFRRLKTIKAYAEVELGELEDMIHSTGFFRQKAKSIKNMAVMVLDKYDGVVPCTMEELVKLPGVGRKTANVVLGQVFGVPGLPVDTHVIRVTNRLGLTSQSDPEKIEAELCEILPKKNWSEFSLLLISHGRQICGARKPLCDKCGIRKECSTTHKYSTAGIFRTATYPS